MVLVHIWSHGPLPPFGRHSLMSEKDAVIHNIPGSKTNAYPVHTNAGCFQIKCNGIHTSGTKMAGQNNFYNSSP